MSKSPIVILLVLLLIAPLTVAQEALTETFTVPDSGLTFQYPDGWSVEIAKYNVIVLSLHRGGRLRSQMSLYTPPVVAAFGFGDETDPATLVERAGATFANADSGELSQVAIGDATGTSYTYIDDNGEHAMLIGLPFAGQLMMIAVTTADDNLDELGDLALAIAATFSQPSPVPQSLQHYDATWQEAVAELEKLGLIATGGNLIFRENRAFFSGQGNWFTPLAQRAPRTDVVMAGDLQYTSSNPGGLFTTEFCALTARIVTENNTATKYLDVGVDKDGDVFYIDRYGDGLLSLHQGYETLDNFDFAVPHHYLILALDDHLTVFIDGKLVFENRRIEERAGTYGITLIGQGPQALCEATNIWAYEAPTFQPGVCAISAASTVNKRSGPGTNFDVAGQLATNVERHAQGQATGTDGFIWWQLDDDTWVRNDVVQAGGDCRNIPEVDG